jgi:hypothetical protein
MRGELTGKWEPTGRKIPKTGADGNPVLDKNGNPAMIDEMRPERRRSYDIIEYMIDRCFGRPPQSMDITQKFEELPSSLAELTALEKYLDEKAKKLDESHTGRKTAKKKGGGKTPSS